MLELREITELSYPHSYVGICNICGWSGPFIQAHRSIREGFACGGCRGSLRYRAQAEAILSLFNDAHPNLVKLVDDPAWQQLQIYEPGVTGPFRQFFRGADWYTQSFYWEDVRPGQQRDGLVCQDLTRTTYEDCTFDLIITSDIFEHVRKPLDGFREMHRILKPGGYHIWSVPAVDPLPPETVSRIDTTTDDDIPILPLVYHGSGMSGGRSVVYTDFGEDVPELLEQTSQSTLLRRYQPDKSVRPLVTFVSRRYC